MNSFVKLIIAATIIVAASASQQNNDVRNYYKKFDNPKNTGLCNQCAATVADLQSVLQDEIKYKKLKEVLKLGCSFYVDETIEDCSAAINLLDLYKPKLQSMLTNPQDICRNTLMLCGDEKQAPIGTHGLILALKIAMKSTATTKFESKACDDCALVVNTLYAILEESGVQQAIKSVALKVCSLVKRKSLSEKCAQEVNDNFDTVVHNVLRKLSDPIQICTTLHMCGSAPSSLQNLVEPKVLPLKELLKEQISRYHRLHHVLFNKLPRLQISTGTASGCEACKITFTTFDALMNTPTILKCVSFGLTELICMKILPAPINASCWDFMDTYLQAIVEMTINNWTPDQVCNLLKACPATSSTFLKTITKPKLQLPGSTGCEACQSITNFLSSEFQQQAFQQDVIGLIKALICVHGSSTEAQCSSMVDQYIPFLMEQATDFMMSPSFCQFLHLCPKVGPAEDDFFSWSKLCTP